MIGTRFGLAKGLAHAHGLSLKNNGTNSYYRMWLFMLALAAILLVSPQSSLAAIVCSGDTNPEDPSGWTSTTYGYVGNEGIGSLSINDGSTAYSDYGYIGYESGASGTATVSGSGSIWEYYHGLRVGHYGSGSLSVSNGGTVHCIPGKSGSCIIGCYSDSTGTVTISGSGSTLTSQGTLSVGSSGDGTLSVSDGGYVSSRYSYIGSESGATGEVTIDGSDSAWDNLALFIGHLGNGSLSITGGSSVSSGTSAGAHNSHIGYDPGSTGTVTVSGSNSSWALENACFYVGNSGNGSLSITNGGSVNNTYGYLGYAPGSSGEVTVSGTNSSWTNNRYLYIGYSGNGSLSIGGNGSVSNMYSAYIGYNVGSTGEVTVSDNSSTWTIGSDLFVGHSGNGILSITNGSSVSVAGTTYVGYNENSTGAIHYGANGGALTTETIYVSASQIWGTGTINTQGFVVDADIVLDGNSCSGSTFTATIPSQDGGQITMNMDLSNMVDCVGVGFNENGSLTIQNGATVGSEYGYIGYNTGSTGTVTVSDTGSAWNIGSSAYRYLYVGHSGNGTLSITNGGSVSSSYSVIGYNSGSQGNATVDSSGSTLSTNYLGVGRAGNGTLSISNGGSVSSGTGSIGGEIDSTGTVTISDSGSTWSNTGYLYVGTSGNGTLSITDGGGVTSGLAYIGYNSGSSGEVAVSGNGSTWNKSGDLYVGYSGNGTLSITDGGSVSLVNNNTYVGYNEGSTGTLDFGDNGGMLTTKSIFYSASQLWGTGTINAKGVVSDTNIVLDGSGGSASSYEVAIASQDGGQVTMHLDLSIATGILGAGYKGNGTLTIQNGAVVQSSTGYVGYDVGSTGEVTISGNNSTWNNRSLYVGNLGNGTLLISGGSSVINTSSFYIGYESDSTGEVIVSGNSSTCTNSCAINVGHSGNGMLSINSGGSVSNATGYIGYYSGSSGEVTVCGSDSSWTNSGSLYVGNSGNGILSITDGSSVAVTSMTYVGYSDDSTGTLNFGAHGGTLTTTNIFFSASQLWGNGTINTKGVVSDSDVILDGSSVSAPQFTANIVSQDGGQVDMNLDLSDAVTWLGAGYRENGSLAIINGAAVQSSNGCVGYRIGSEGTVMVSGEDSRWTTYNNLNIGTSGNGTLSITNGGNVVSHSANIGYNASSMGEVSVSGNGSAWTTNNALYVGRSGSGNLHIEDGGLVSSAGTLTIDYNGGDDSFINMAAGGMLALLGDAHDSIDDFLYLVGGTDAIRYWDESASDWSHILNATYGDDFTLEYIDDTGSDLYGYTILKVLTTTVPGDANWDGMVNDLDAAVLAENWCEAGGWSDGDFNHDGVVNAVDAAIMAAHWGHGTTESTTVPEPSALVMLMGVAVLLLARRHDA